MIKKNRNTIQRELVLGAVQEMHTHVTADEVYAFLSSKHPTISKGTVYRNLGILADEKKIRRVELPDGPNRFDFRLADHYHVRCIRCGSVFDVDMDKISGLDKYIHDSQGMIFLDHDILFKGICADCQQRTKEEQ